MCLPDFIRNYLPALTANGNVDDAGLLMTRFLEVAFLVETYLVIEQDDILAAEPFQDLLLFFAAISFAHLEFDCQLLCFL